MIDNMPEEDSLSCRVIGIFKNWVKPWIDDNEEEILPSMREDVSRLQGFHEDVYGRRLFAEDLF